METATIYFKNGMKKKVYLESANIIRARSTSSEGAKRWQFFSDNVSDNLVYGINMDEVCFIENDGTVLE